jgi:hypothetical protein
MKSANIVFWSFIFGFFILLSCETPEMVSDIPEIKFKSISFANDTDILGNDIKKVKLTFSLIDGDGDIGIPEDGYPGFDTLDNKNLFVQMYQKIDGQFVRIELFDEYTTPYQAPLGQDKTLKADYEVTMEPSIAFFNYDTIKYTFYIFDRKLHQSNIGETPELPADTLGLIE